MTIPANAGPAGGAAPAPAAPAAMSAADSAGGAATAPAPGPAGASPGAPAGPSTTPGAAPAAAPSAPTAPRAADSAASPSSPGPAGERPTEPVDQRLRDTQAWGHRLAGQLRTILNDPELGPRAKARLGLAADTAAPAAPSVPHPGPATSSPAAEPAAPGIRIDPARLEQAFQRYQAFPEGQEREAFAYLLQTAAEIAADSLLPEAEQRVLGHLARRSEEAHARRQAENAKASIATAVNDVVQQIAPDVDLELFWSWAAPRAARETPPHLTDPIERIQWQTERAIELTRDKQRRFAAPASQAAAEATQLQHRAGSVVPGGGGTPAPTATDSQTPKPVPFVEQMRLLKRQVAGAVR